MNYTEQDVFCLARRYRNAKRSYLLVDPLQAKHIPVSPRDALAMMRTLGRMLAENYQGASLVIGFAETATAIGAAAASCFSEECVYLQTTREALPAETDCIVFLEEHSHATEQKLYRSGLGERIAATPYIILIDDEFSTGKTFLHIIKELKTLYPDMEKKEIIAASIVNRLTPENEKRLAEEGIQCEYLVRLSEEFCSEKQLTVDAEKYEVVPPVPPITDDTAFFERISPELPFEDPRFGVNACEYTKKCSITAEQLLFGLKDKLAGASRVLVLGTEECMYPALIFGEKLEESGLVSSVFCHATTRSPIGICSVPGYPIHSGIRLHSFYADERDTFLYDLQNYDAVIVLTDTEQDDTAACSELSAALRAYGRTELIVIEGGRNVQYL